MLISTLMEKKTCPKCGYTWTPRVETPKACPECKVRLKRKQTNLSHTRPGSSSSGDRDDL
jgi:predicted Zn-ribbon and HTH transcriptional regulator